VGGERGRERRARESEVEGKKRLRVANEGELGRRGRGIEKKCGKKESYRK
jgi:hypothetical protein